VVAGPDLVLPDRGRVTSEIGGDLSSAEPGDDQGHHLPLPAGQRGQGGADSFFFLIQHDQVTGIGFSGGVGGASPAGTSRLGLAR